MGLVGTITSWQQQIFHFGHKLGHEYSVLVFDNRGIGRSDKPLSRYTTSQMGKDVIEVIDHVGWTADRQVNLMGISLGGMIAQEIACLIPQRLQSLTLLCTTASLESGKGVLEGIFDRILMLRPKTEDQAIVDTALQIFVPDFLTAPDTFELPSYKTTPMCGRALDTPDGEHARFDSNFQRFQAQEIAKRHGPGYFTQQGFLCQLMAAAGHQKSAAQLKKMADEVGRDRIMVVHGTRDKMIVVQNGLKLIEMIKPGVGLVVDDLGHAPIFERTKWFNDMLDERLKVWAKL